MAGRRRYVQIGGRLVEVTKDVVPCGTSHFIQGDIQPFIAEDGRYIGSKPKMRDYMRETGLVPIQEHDNVFKDHHQRRGYAKKLDKSERLAAIVDACKGHGW